MFADGDGAQRGVLKGSMAKATIAVSFLVGFIERKQFLIFFSLKKASKRAKNTHSSGQYASEPQYSFCNARTHDVVYDLMLFAQVCYWWEGMNMNFKLKTSLFLFDRDVNYMLNVLKNWEDVMEVCKQLKIELFQYFFKKMN